MFVRCAVCGVFVVCGVWVCGALCVGVLVWVCACACGRWRVLARARVGAGVGAGVGVGSCFCLLFFAILGFVFGIFCYSLSFEALVLFFRFLVFSFEF